MTDAQLKTLIVTLLLCAGGSVSDSSIAQAMTDADRIILECK